MVWLGKLLGGGLGLIYGGPIGAVLGAVVGHQAIDRRVASVRRKKQQSSSSEEKQSVYFVATFSMLAKLVKVDGHVTRTEVDAIEQLMCDRFRLSPDARRVAIRVFDEAKASSANFEDFALQFYRHFYDSRQVLYSQLEILLEVALSDGPLRQEEEQLLRRAAAVFLLDDEFSLLLQRTLSVQPEKLDRFYSILGCKPGDSMQEVKKKYRRLAMEHHPDRVKAKGMQEEFASVAEERFKEIQQAYDKVTADIESRGA